MIRDLNRKFQDFFRPKRLAFGKFIWDKKDNKIKCTLENIIKNQEIKSILFLRYDGKIGDSVINSMMFREIKKQFPNIKIGVVTREGAKSVLESNKYIDNIFIYEKNTKKIKKLAEEIRNKKYDLLIDFSEMLRVQQMMFINLCKAKINMGLNKDDWNLFDISYNYPSNMKHISDLYVYILKILGVKNINSNYDLQINKEVEKKSKDFISKLSNEKYIVLNPFAASKHRSLNIEKIDEIIKIILAADDYSIILLAPGKEQRDNMEKFQEKYKDKVYIPETKSIEEVIELVKHSILVISPDTSIIHIASAFEKPLIGFYRKDLGKDNNSTIWGPNNKNSIIVWAVGNEKEKEIDINNFKLEDFINAYKNF